MAIRRIGLSAIVAPFAGAWIEIALDWKSTRTDSVAPFAGAWIEISGDNTRDTRKAWSLPSRERGLKWQEVRAHRPRDGRSLRGSVD